MLLTFNFVMFLTQLHGSENFKTLFLQESATELLQTSPEVSSQWSSKNAFVGFLKNYILMKFSNFIVALYGGCYDQEF